MTEDERIQRIKAEIVATAAEAFAAAQFARFVPVSSEAGRYGNWLLCTKRSWDPGPLRFTMRAITSPVTDEPSW